jgi:hypothetical protein
VSEAPVDSTEEPSRKGPRLLLGLLVLGLLAGLGAGAWALFGPGLELERTELEDGGLRTQRFRLQVSGTGRQGPDIYLAPEVMGSGLSGRSDGTYRLSWHGLDSGFEYRVRLEDDDSLVIEDRRETLVVKPDEVLLLSAGGAEVLRGRTADDLLPVVANPRLYVGAKLSNSAPRGAQGSNEAGLVAGTEVHVKGVYVGSPAEASGLQAGDVLLSVESGGRRLEIQSRQALATWWCEITAGNVLTFEVRRGGETLSVPVKTRDRTASEFRGASSISDDPSYLQRH